LPQSSRLHQWARLFKRMFDINTRHCPNCGAGELKILGWQVVAKTFTYLG
jgi:hypothetical protein